MKIQIRMKQKYLLDECVCENIGLGGSDFIRSVDVLGTGASDAKVWKLVKKTNSMLVTNDKRFLFDALSNNKPVWYYAKGIIIRPRITKNYKYSDVISHYSEKTGEIVIP